MVSQHGRDGEHGRGASEDRNEVLVQYVQFVRRLIERCMVMYMTREQVVTMLYRNRRIDPRFVNSVWHRMEQENPEYFRVYNLRLHLKKQIILYNQLCEKQIELSNQLLEKRSLDMDKGCSHIMPAVNSSIGVPAANNLYPYQQSGDAPSDNHERATRSHDQRCRPMECDPPSSSNMQSIEGFQHALDGGRGFSLDLNLSYNTTTNLTNTEAPHSHQRSLELFPDLLGGSSNGCDVVAYYIANTPCPEPRFTYN